MGKRCPEADGDAPSVEGLRVKAKVRIVPVLSKELGVEEERQEDGIEAAPPSDQAQHRHETFTRRRTFDLISLP